MRLKLQLDAKIVRNSLYFVCYCSFSKCIHHRLNYNEICKKPILLLQSVSFIRSCSRSRLFIFVSYYTSFLITFFMNYITWKNSTFLPRPLIFILIILKRSFFLAICLKWSFEHCIIYFLNENLPFSHIVYPLTIIFIPCKVIYQFTSTFLYKFII